MGKSYGKWQRGQIIVLTGFTLPVPCPASKGSVQNHDIYLQPSISCVTVLIIQQTITTLKFLAPSKFHTRLHFGHKLLTMRRKLPKYRGVLDETTC